jgi:hypothetical protein
MSVTAILAGVAAKVGAPIIKGLITKHTGPVVGGLAGTVIDAVAGHAGVPADRLSTLPPEKLEAAVLAAERDLAALQRETNALFKMEHDEETMFAWGWRPGMMWLIGFLWAWSIVVVPLVNALLARAIPVYLGELAALTVTYTALYMGGHTVKEWRKAG